MPQPHVGHQPSAEEAFLARERAVDELIGDDEGARRQFLLERPTSRKRDDLGDAGALQAIDVGAEVKLAGRDAVAAAVARQEHHLLAPPLRGQFAHQKLV